MRSDEFESTPAPVRKKKGNKISLLNEEFDLSLFVMIAQKRWKLLVCIFIVILTGAGTYLRYAQRMYQENCVIQVGSQNTASKVLNTPSNIYGGGGDDEVAESVELMHSGIFLEKVFRALPMEVSYYMEGTFKNYERYLTSPYSAEVDSLAEDKLVRVPIYINFNSLTGGKLTFAVSRGSKNNYLFSTGQWCETPYGKIKIHIITASEIAASINNLKKDASFFRINNYNDLSKHYAGQITVRIINSDAKTIEVSCRDEDDTKAADIANTIGKMFINEVVKKRSESDESILSFINDQMDTIYNRIRHTETKMGDTLNRSVSGGPSESAELQGSNATYLMTLDEKIADVALEQTQLRELEKRIGDQKDVDPMNLIMQIGLMDGGDALKSNVEGLHGLINERQTASFDATDANLKMQELDSLIVQQKAIIYKSIDLLNDKLVATRNDYITQKNDIESKFLTPVSVRNLEDLRLKRQATIDEKYYDMLLEKKAEYAISKAGFVAESEILETAIPSWIPVAPQKTVTMTIAILVSSALSVILLIVIYLFYNNITSVYEIERLAESPITILGIIPKYEKEIPASQIIVNHNPKSILAEAFRSIRTNLQFIANETEAKVIAITSTVSGEGKTFVCVNLAGIIAYSGKKVIVIDLDMRRPRIHSAFGLDNSKGMSTLLIGKYSIEDVIQKTETENLDIITAGPIPPNPSELVISKTMDEVLAKLKTMYDIILVDNPPVGLVTDGITMLQRADYPIYLMRVDYSKREFIYFIDKLYFENHFHKLSVILNSVDFQRQKYGYSYYKYGYYGYGYGYTYGHGNYYET
jgi:tyrosine-protein kinase Etk/Wzc